MGKVSLKCQTCGGTMEIDEDREVMFCPYCGSKEIFEIGDAVRIEKIRADRDLRLVDKKYEQEQKNWKEGMIVCIGIMLFCLAMIFVPMLLLR